MADLPSSAPALVPRGARPDAETASEILLVKNVSFLRATYQIRLLAFKAAQDGKTLVLAVPAECRFAPALDALAASRPGLIARRALPRP